MAKTRQAAQLPATMRNPFICLKMVTELRKHAANMEGNGGDPADVLMTKAFAKELEVFANAKIGTHANNL
jgi:hypothetical protein